MSKFWPRPAAAVWFLLLFVLYVEVATAKLHHHKKQHHIDHHVHKTSGGNHLQPKGASLEEVPIIGVFIRYPKIIAKYYKLDPTDPTADPRKADIFGGTVLGTEYVLIGAKHKNFGKVGNYDVVLTDVLWNEFPSNTPNDPPTELLTAKNVIFLDNNGDGGRLNAGNYYIEGKDHKPPWEAIFKALEGIPTNFDQVLAALREHGLLKTKPTPAAAMAATVIEEVIAEGVRTETRRLGDTARTGGTEVV
jgi:hypothetical protein